ncbi:hypothetical protein NL676_019397 [Syzygium grande]|nr:hypothetical protein NL676_019397 [Syzygium grande]
MSSENDAWRIIHVPARPPFPPDQQLTVNMVAAQIEQPKLTNTIIRRLSQIAPLEDLHHVKRVKKKCLEGVNPSHHLHPPHPVVTSIPADLHPSVARFGGTHLGEFLRPRVTWK